MKSKDRGRHRTGTSQKVSHKRRCTVDGQIKLGQK
jgi:hypothetical protein